MSGEGNSKVRFSTVLKLAGAFCAFLLGSGYATGQEIRLFFTSQGLFSFGALTISMILFMWFGSTLIAKGYDTGLKATHSIFRIYCGKYVGFALEILIPVFLFSIVVIMVSGTGAALHQQFGLNPYVGRLLMGLVSMITVFFGLSRLVQVIGLIGPVIIVVSVTAGIFGILHGTLDFGQADAAAKALDLPKADTNWAASGLLYTAFQVLGAAPFFAGLGTQAQNRKEAVWGGLMGGFMYIGAAAVMSTGMLLNIDSLFDKEVPALAMAGVTAPWMVHAFTVVLLLGIYSTAAPVLWSVCNRIALDGTRRFKLVTVALGLGAIVGGLLPFGKLVGFIYPNMGVIGVAFMVLMLVGPFIQKKYGEMKGGS